LMGRATTMYGVSAALKGLATTDGLGLRRSVNQ